MPKLKRKPSEATQVIMAQAQTSHDHIPSRFLGWFDENSLKIAISEAYYHTMFPDVKILRIHG